MVNLYLEFVKQKNIKQLMLISNLFLLLMFICNIANASSEPEVVVKNVINDVLEVLKTYDIQSIESKSSNELIEVKITQDFDLTRMNRMVLDKGWDYFSQAQKDEFTYQFRRLFIRDYAKKLSKIKSVDARLKLTTCAR